ncbi:MAG: hypothetical protein AAGN82_19030 [Myxococcota bacterium]
MADDAVAFVCGDPLLWGPRSQRRGAALSAAEGSALVLSRLRRPGAMRTRALSPAGRFSILLLVVLGGCARDCRFLSGDRTYESLDGPVRAELVGITRWGGGKVSAPLTSFLVRVHTEPKIDVAVACTRATFAGDEHHVAYRCLEGDEKGRGWTVIRLLGGDRHLVDCNVSAGEAAPDFGALPPIVDRADQLLDCRPNREGDLFTELVRTLEETAGAQTAAAFMVRNLDFVAERPYLGDGWRRGFAALSPAGRQAAQPGLCGALDDPTLGASSFRRAVAACLPSEVPSAKRADAAIARLQRVLTAPEPEPTDVWWTAGWSLNVAPDRAKPMACNVLDGASSSVESDVRPVAAGALVLHTLDDDDAPPCPALRRLVRPRWLCDEPVSCAPRRERHRLCVASELRDTRTFLKSAFAEGKRGPDGLRGRLDTPPWPRIGLSAAYALDDVAEVRRRNARLDYDVEPRAGTGVEECSPTKPPGGACQCPEYLLDLAICKLATDASTTRIHHCDVTIDDEARVVRSQHFCAPEGDACGPDAGCCEPTRCDVTTHRCVAPEPAAETTGSAFPPPG